VGGDSCQFLKTRSQSVSNPQKRFTG